jgi:predicted negative regulator of RcsB-dependent stress response
MNNKQQDSESTTVVVRRIAIVLAAVLALFGVAFILDKFLSYKIAEGYVDRIATTYGLNPYLSEFATWIVFAVVLYATWQLFNFSRVRRRIGIGIFFAMVLVSPLLLWFGTRDHLVGTRCYVLERDRVYFGERPNEIHRLTGKMCQPITPLLRARLEAYNQGRRPQLFTQLPDRFFDSITGEPIVWFGRVGKEIQLFDLVGYHPGTGEELVPITSDVIREFRDQYDKRLQDSRLPSAIDPAKSAWFDMRTGEALVYYWRGSKGEWEFFDKEGFHPRSGERLRKVDSTVLAEWQKSLRPPGPTKEELRKEELRKEELKKEELRKEELRKEELRKEELRKEELRKEELRKEELRKEEFRKKRADVPTPPPPPLPRVDPKCQSATMAQCVSDFRTNFSRAEESCKQVVACEPKNARALSQLGLIQARNGFADTATRTQESALRLARAANDEDSIALISVRLANLAIRQNELGKADAVLRGIPQTENLRPVARAGIRVVHGRIAIRRNELNAARQHLETAIGLMSTGSSNEERAVLAEAYYELGAVDLRQNDRQGACRNLNRSRGINAELSQTMALTEIDRQRSRLNCS